MAELDKHGNKWRKLSRTFPQRKERFTTPSGLEVESLYYPQGGGEDYLRDLGFPGDYPYTRGIYPAMYRNRLWTHRLFVGAETARESNQRILALLEKGKSALSLSFDLPTQMGYDSDHALARGEVGRVGVAIDSLEDMEDLLAGVPLEEVTLSLNVSGTAAIILAMYLVAAEKQGVMRQRLRGTLQNDILKEYLARGAYIFPPEPSLRLVIDTMSYCSREVPGWNSLSIGGYHMREAGATAVQEIAFAFGNALAYLKSARQAGLDQADVIGHLTFFFAAQQDILEEVAKFRAARRIWARLLREDLGVEEERFWRLRFHVHTSGSALPLDDPRLNAVRVAYQALAAVLGGAQSLHIHAPQEGLVVPGKSSSELSEAIHDILARESGVAETIDPLGGSYYMEHLTRELEKRIDQEMANLARRGGAVRGLGWMQMEIQESAYLYQRRVEEERVTVAGITSTGVPSFHHDLAVDQRQVARLHNLKKTRAVKPVAESLQLVREAARSRENLLPPLLEAVRGYATLGEISGVLREVWGEYQLEVYA